MIYLIHLMRQIKNETHFIGFSTCMTKKLNIKIFDNTKEFSRIENLVIDNWV